MERGTGAWMNNEAKLDSDSILGWSTVIRNFVHIFVKIILWYFIKYHNDRRKTTASNFKKS